MPFRSKTEKIMNSGKGAHQSLKNAKKNPGKGSCSKSREEGGDGSNKFNE